METPHLPLQGTPAFSPQVPRRRKLLPWWVLIFTWIFLLFTVALPVGLVMALLNRPFNLSLLGLATDNPVSVTGVFLMLLFAFKGIVAFGLWTEKEWAVRMAKIDAILSAAICCFAMVYSWMVPVESGGYKLYNFNFRLELLIIIPYYHKMRQIQYDWENFGAEEIQIPPAPEEV